jgi:cytochrome c
MFDTMTMTKTVGGVCGALLIFLFANWAAEGLYHGGAGHGEGAEQAYSIAVDGEAAGEGGEAEAPAGPAYAEVAAAADAAAGEKVFVKCKGCHKLDGGKGTGPYLNGIVGRAPGSVAEFGYSDAMRGVTEAWTPEHLYAFLQNPKGMVPGTKMGFAGLAKPEDRANVIAYLATLP